MDDGDEDGHPEVGADERTGGLIASVEAAGAAEAEIDWDQHQSRAVRDRHRKRPKRELCGSYPRQRSRMAPVEESEDAKADDQKARADPDLPLPIDERDQQREWKDHQEHRQQ